MTVAISEHRRPLAAQAVRFTGIVMAGEFAGLAGMQAVLQLPVLQPPASQPPASQPPASQPSIWPLQSGRDHKSVADAPGERPVERPPASRLKYQTMVRPAGPDRRLHQQLGAIFADAVTAGKLRQAVDRLARSSEVCDALPQLRQISQFILAGDESYPQCRYLQAALTGLGASLLESGTPAKLALFYLTVAALGEEDRRQVECYLDLLWDEEPLARQLVQPVLDELPRLATMLSPQRFARITCWCRDELLTKLKLESGLSGFYVAFANQAELFPDRFLGLFGQALVKVLAHPKAMVVLLLDPHFRLEPAARQALLDSLALDLGRGDAAAALVLLVGVFSAPVLATGLASGSRARRAGTEQSALFSSDFDRLAQLRRTLRRLREGQALHVFRAAGLADSECKKMMHLVVHRVAPHMRATAVDAEMQKLLALEVPAAGRLSDPQVFETLRAAAVIGLLGAALPPLGVQTFNRARDDALLRQLPADPVGRTSAARLRRLMLLVEMYAVVVLNATRKAGGSWTAKKMLVSFLNQQELVLGSQAALRPRERARVLDVLDHLRGL